MTGQTILDTCELLNAELQLQAGEADVTKGLLALNVAQDYFESLAAQRGKLKGSSVGTVVTAAATEATTFPTGLLRLDRLQYIDAATSKPVWDIIPSRRAGGHAVSAYWPINITNPATSGKPTAYWTNGTSIYWSPTPDAIYTIRWMGFQRATDITASGTFAYDDIVRLPIATFAVRLLKSGLDDQVTDLAALALETFSQTLDALGGFNRDGAVGMEYTHTHFE